MQILIHITVDVDSKETADAIVSDVKDTLEHSDGVEFEDIIWVHNRSL